MKFTSIIIFLFLVTFISVIFLFQDSKITNDEAQETIDAVIPKKKYNLDNKLYLNHNKLQKAPESHPDNVVSNNNDYWKIIKNRYGEDFDRIRTDMQSGIINGLEIFNTVAINGTVEDQTWFVDIMREYNDDALFRDILKTSCCGEQLGIGPDKDLGFLVFSFAIEQFNNASAYALMDYYEESISPENQHKSLYLLGGATLYTAGENMNDMIVNWLENKISSQPFSDDISIAMAYFRASQGNPEKTMKAEKILLPLIEENIFSLDPKISLDQYLGNVLPSVNLKEKVRSLLKNENLSDLNKKNLSEIYEYWNLFDNN